MRFLLASSGSLISMEAMKKISLVLCAALLFSACERTDNPDASAQIYETRGIVRGFSPDRATIEVEHETIRGFMPSMTMPFVVRDQKEIAGLKLGDAIAFRLTVTPKDFWISQVKRVARDEVQIAEATPNPSPSEENGPRLREGDQMPVFSLTNQNGERMTLESFRGRPFVLTFIFTRCPIPNFCPRMSNNFSQLQTAIKKGEGTMSEARLLSITLDPAFDTPQILKEYAAHLEADPNIWVFATGDTKEIDALTQTFSVYRQNEGGTISHGLATALVNKQGAIEKIWRGNGWTPEEVIEQINRHAH